MALKGWIKTEGDAKAQVAIQSFSKGYKNNKWQQLVYLQGDSDWISFNKTVIIPEWTEWSEIKLDVKGDGKAWFDEIADANGDVDNGDALTASSKNKKPLTVRQEMLEQSLAKDKPWVPGYGMWDSWKSSWFGQHDDYVERTKKGDIEVVAYGDSIMIGWEKGVDKLVKQIDPELTAVNYGIGGDTTRQILWRAGHGELDGISPKLIILGIGTNNLYDDANSGNNQEIVKGIFATVDLLHEKCPSARILLLSLLPRQNEYFCNRVYAINAMIEAEVKKYPFLTYHDRTDKFQSEPSKIKDELFKSDKLHLVDAGYVVWDADLQPVLEKVLNHKE
ncbi:MAG: GDSL-type esterase/lipase family protein [Kiritimatiellae bacterium]|nr:GDSL-type esterase/lipase family protein [Kiritimatiellia bacterium]